MLSLTALACSPRRSWGYHDFQVGLYLKILFGLQLPEYLFAVLVLLVHALVDQKHVAMLVALVVYFLIVFSSVLGVEHKLLVYGSSPGWSFTDMRGFGQSVGPWLVFKVYWAAWALLLAVVATLLWVRGREVAFEADRHGAAWLHRRDGCRRGHGGGAHPHARRLHLLQHQRDQRVHHGR